jgi:hypothetical protein
MQKVLEEVYEDSSRKAAEGKREWVGFALLRLTL